MARHGLRETIYVLRLRVFDLNVVLLHQTQLRAAPFHFRSDLDAPALFWGSPDQMHGKKLLLHI